MTDKGRDRGLSIFDGSADDTTIVSAPASAGAQPQTFAAGSGSHPATQPPPPARPTQPTASAVSFPVVRRGGYDRSAVDSFLSQHQASQSSAAAEMREAQGAVSRLQQRIGELEHVVAEQGTPTYAGLGSHAAAILRLAEEQSATVTADTKRDAEQMREQMLREAVALKADAEKEASDIRTVQLQEIEERRVSVLAEAQQERGLARAEAVDILASAHREADQLKLAVQQETNALRTSAKREGEQARAAADREATESRRMLAVEKERLTKEASERHTSAVAESNRLVEEAEARATSAEERARAAMAAATRHREQATTESERSLARARREGEQIVTAARRQAEQIVANAGSDVSRQSEQARTELETLQKRRDGIVAQLAQLRDVVATFAGADLAPSGSRQPEASTALGSDTEGGTASGVDVPR